MGKQELVAPPFPYFGGKRRVASQVWEGLGDVANYVEPFAGSLAVLLNRPLSHAGTTSTVNDMDGFIANFWRALKHDPDGVAEYADDPVNETDLIAKHLWLVNTGRTRLLEGLESDPEWYDPKVAGGGFGACARGSVADGARVPDRGCTVPMATPSRSDHILATRGRG